MELEAFAKRAALVTGSSRGIGRAIARRLAAAGADLVIHYRKSGGSSQAKAESLAAEIQAMGRRAMLVAADIASREQVRRLFEETRKAYGRLDFVVLNAARAPFKPIERLPERELRQLVDTNYLGNIYCIQEAVPLLEQGRGRLVFISSLGSRFYNPSYPLGSIKAAMEAVVRDCAESLRAKQIGVNGVCAGLVRTDSFKVLRQYWEEIDRIPPEMLVEPEEIAEVVLFLCAPASSAIHGQMIVVDRGLSNRLYGAFRNP
jgi:enoyl-[acyl-carrier protein] reductase III